MKQKQGHHLIRDAVYLGRQKSEIVTLIRKISLTARLYTLKVHIHLVVKCNINWSAMGLVAVILLSFVVVVCLFCSDYICMALTVDQALF